MTVDEFWNHIRATHRRDPDEHTERLVARLAKLTREDIVDFCFWWGWMHTEAYRINLWAAAYYVNGGCSDDGFDYFRNWLILQGRDVFTAAVADPNTLADVCKDGKADGEFMCDHEPGWQAWDRAVGSGTDEAFNLLFHARHPEKLAAPELGKHWDFDNSQMIRQYLPRFYNEDVDKR